MVEVSEELLLRHCDGLGVDGGNLRGGVSLMDGAFGFRGEKGAVGLRVGVALGDSCGDVRGADSRWAGAGLRDAGEGGGRGGSLSPASAMGRDTIGDLLLEGGGGEIGLRQFERRQGSCGVVGEFVTGVYFKLC